MSERFLKVPRDRLYQQVVKQIQDLIIGGELRPGDRLPSETELCEQFGVSRTVIREATKCLAERGLLSAEPGRGTFVTAMSHRDLSSSIDLFVKSSEVSDRNLIEARELLEVKIVELAAERAQPEHLVRMQLALEQMNRSVESMEDYISADLEFHMALAEATQNDIFLALISSLIDGLQDVRRTSAEERSGLLLAQRHHRLIYECVRDGVPDRAAEAMREHLQEVARRFELVRSKRVKKKHP